MEELKTILGTEIPVNTRGIVYFCNYTDNELKVFHEILCTSSLHALNIYANVPNLESQVISGSTYDELITKMHKLHANIKNKEWLKNLKNTL